MPWRTYLRLRVLLRWAKGEVIRKAAVTLKGGVWADVLRPFGLPALAADHAALEALVHREGRVMRR